ncbi:S8 family serine peptidase [Novosphingobium sp. Gsoil 351]|uniref:S8 family serine peptidase n=1 Tax=Novosphingobium sp. Gsoil 351 TaxID=2675225 RepID=UPI0012B4D9E8|nr:S8 family serine peptidase [Novosphingobium sp. Gsoil 351]QGN55133.1 S8 family serine peptidase [Novosphingobium sp. Gsoil 351]
MPRNWTNGAAAAVLALATPASAQLALPAVPLPPVSGLVERATGTVGDTLAPVVTSARELARLRVVRLDELVRRSRGLIERDVLGAPARRGELLLTDPTPEQLAKAKAAGFAVLENEPIEGLGFTVARLRVPERETLSGAQKRLVGLLPGANVSADLLHFQAGGVAFPAEPQAAAPGASVTTPIGVIDGAPGGAALGEARGFAKNAPLASNHGSAIASLLALCGARDVRFADVYGADPAGGNALALARALGWLVTQGVRVVTISLVGPASPVVAKAVAAAQARGVAVVAAVGNDGPAAPPSYPASYPGVIAVTAVDGRNRALIEAGRASHLDYAAPGADILASDARGRWVRVRGTSYATPLVAARLAAAWGPKRVALARLDQEARDLGPRGADPTYGRGLLCETCRRIH